MPPIRWQHDGYQRGERTATSTDRSNEPRLAFTTAPYDTLRVRRMRLRAAAATLAATVLTTGAAASSARLFFLDIRGGRIVSANTDGSDPETIITGLRGTPDGIVVDAAAGYMYWTHMGAAAADDGYVQRAKLDGSELTKIVPDGGTFTPKQLKLDAEHHRLYWADREGMRIMRANVDGSHVETLIETGHGDADRANQANWCVGIALDVERGKVYLDAEGRQSREHRIDSPRKPRGPGRHGRGPSARRRDPDR